MGGDIDQNQRGGVDMILTNGNQASSASEGSADQDRAAVAKCGNNALEILNHGILTIISVGRPVRIAVTPRIKATTKYPAAPSSLPGTLHA
ncbi:protein of unknown function [Georgfuchsia toluolica]|uniref:Uncharacterized protein n=1 Tax=Georgfuchsia toluolica TaxID=424218 RepID=A0A916J6L1_9PROT|nr:protein of unknown function [Georgfuchsia toluolica]